MPLTLRDVALAAGVSTATVSRALRGLDNVDQHTRDRIVGIATEMNFSVSQTASRLATGRTGTVGIVTPFMARWYFSEIFAGINEGLEPHDVDLLIHVTERGSDHAGPDASRRLRRRVDGVLVVGMHPDHDEVLALTGMDIPVVLLGAMTSRIPSIAIDDRAAAQQAVEHLIERGHTDIALISGRELPTRFVPENDRLAGYLDALRAHNLPVDERWHRVGDFTTPGGERAMTELLAVNPRPTAVFSMSDEMAYGAMRAMTLAGVTAGNDKSRGEIAIIGFDGHDLANIFDLSTIAQPVRGLGQAAAHRLMALLGPAEPPEAPPAGSEHRPLVMPVELIERRSTGG